MAISSSAAAMAHQGRYPVIFFTFKDIQAVNIETFETIFRGLLADLYQQYPELLSSASVNPSRRKQIQALLDQKLSLPEMGNAFRLLSELLYQHYGQKVAILLDEYDSALHAAYTHGYYQELIGFMRALLGAALQDTHIVYSNRESGDGRYDVALLPRAGSTPERPGILMEFKQVDESTELQPAAEQALKQIIQRGYRTELQHHRIEHVLALGLAFCGKEVVVDSAAASDDNSSLPVN